METPTPRLHPLVATAALAVTAVSLAGIAALSGLLPLNRAAASAETTPAAAIATVSPEPTFRAPPAVKSAPPAPRAAAQPARSPVATEVALPAPAPAAPMRVAEALPAPCMNCGVVDNVRAVEQEGTGSGIGAVAGGVLGGILGNQVGKGNGNKLATILGAVGGAYAGHQVEKSRNKTLRYEIDVRMEDGTLRTVTQESQPVWRIGERVRVENGTLHRADAAPAVPAAPNYDRI